MCLLRVSLKLIPWILALIQLVKWSGGPWGSSKEPYPPLPLFGVLSPHLFVSPQTGLGERFDRKKVRIAEKVEPFSGRTFFLQFFLVHMEPEVLQQWQTTYFKACSK